MQKDWYPYKKAEQTTCDKGGGDQMVQLQDKGSQGLTVTPHRLRGGRATDSSLEP